MPITDEEWEQQKDGAGRRPPPKPAADSGPRDDFLDVMRVLHVLWRRRRIIGLTLLASFVLGLFYLLLASRIYAATALVELHLRRPRIADDTGYAGEDLRTSAMVSDAMNTEFEKLQSPMVREATARELQKRGADFPDLVKMDPVELTAQLEGQVEFERIPGAFLVKITARSDDPKQAALVANTYADTSVDMVKAMTRATTMQAVEWLSEQIDTYKQALLSSEAKIIEFQRQHNIDGLQNARVTAESALLDINESLVQHQTRAITLRDMVRTLDEIQSSPEKAGVLPSSIPRSEIIQQRLKDYTDALAEENNLRSRYTERHPSVQAQVQRNEALKNELMREIERARETARADLNLAEVFVTSIESNKLQQIKRIDEILQQINTFNTDVLPLKREVDAADSSYRGLLQRIEQARMAADEDTSVVTIYQYAPVPAQAESPRPLLVLATLLLLGGIAGVGLGLLVHLYQDTIATPYDVEVELKQNLIGLVPHVQQDPQQPAEPVARMVLSNKFSPLTEALAALRSALLVQGHRPRGQGWVIQIMSVMPQEGKTTVSGNLALALTKSFKKVLLVDGDMRRPRHHDVFDIPEKRQRLMEALMDRHATEADFALLPYPGPVDNFSIILGHPVEGGSPTDVLETETFERFMQWARQTYEVVIVDSPPLEAASDALVFGRFADDCIMVCRQNLSRKGALRYAIADCLKNGLPMVGVVINDYEASELSYGMGYGGYGRYYGRYYRAGGEEPRLPEEPWRRLVKKAGVHVNAGYQHVVKASGQAVAEARRRLAARRGMKTEKAGDQRP